MQSVRFVFDGTNIGPDDTPTSLEMDEDDSIGTCKTPLVYLFFFFFFSPRTLVNLPAPTRSWTFYPCALQTSSISRPVALLAKSPHTISHIPHQFVVLGADPIM